MQHLYKNFLSDALIYTENRKFWENIAVGLLGDDLFFPYYQETYINGNPFLDGNPIFSAQSKKNGRVLRIIQEEVENFAPEISFWQENIETENGNVDELVICLELSDVTEIMARVLIKAWLLDEKSFEEIAEWGKTMINKIQHFSDEHSNFEEIKSDLIRFTL
jgi:hypothetical protein